MTEPHPDVIALTAGDTVATVHPGAGGRLGQLTVGGRDLLRGPEQGGGEWAQWGSYPMLPWANRIPGGTFDWEGETFTLPVNWPDGTAIHGLAASAAWTVDEADADAATLSVALDEDRYHVAATQRYTLAPGALELTITLANRADWAVPAGIGIHPWFVAAPVRVPADLFWPGAGPLPDGPARAVGPDEDLRALREAPLMDRCYTGLTAQRATVGALELSWSGPITQVVVFTGVPGWICVEPQTMANGGFGLALDGVEPHGVAVLEPGATIEVGYRFDAARPL